MIIDDVIYLDESPYQDDVIAQAVDDVIRSGANDFSSAGNEGAFDNGTSGTWEGDFKSAGKLSTLGSGYQVHDFGNGVISDLTETFSSATSSSRRGRSQGRLRVTTRPHRNQVGNRRARPSTTDHPGGGADDERAVAVLASPRVHADPRRSESSDARGELRPDRPAGAT